jgi:hypothetical protein
VDAEKDNGESDKEGKQMKKTKKIALGLGKITLAIVGGILMPVLIWVALGAAIYQKVHQKKAQTKAVPTLGQILRVGAADK